MAVTALALWLHVSFFLKAGALWRDEASGLELALLPTLRDVWLHGEFDSFPQGWHCVLRFWSACGLGATDLGWRALGLLIGFGILGIFWLNTLQLGSSVPLLGLVLLGLNDLVIIYGDSIRGAGLGSGLGLLNLWAMWTFARHPGLVRALLALIVALLSVHVMSQAASLVLASGLGGMAVALRQRRWWAVAVIVTIGLACAGSLFVYAPAFKRAAQWNVILKFPVDLPWIWKRLSATTVRMGLPGPLLWVGLWLLGIVGTLLAQVSRARGEAA